MPVKDRNSEEAKDFFLNKKKTPKPLLLFCLECCVCYVSMWFVVPLFLFSPSCGVFVVGG